VVVLIGRRVRCCNLPYFVLAGTILIFIADMFTSLGVISLFDYGYVSPSDQLRWQLHSQGLSYIAMGMAFGLAFWSMLAWRRTDVLCGWLPHCKRNLMYWRWSGAVFCPAC
jgi:hypothetical protein